MTVKDEMLEALDKFYEPGCSNCGIKDKDLLVPHHKDPSEKLYYVPLLVRRKGTRFKTFELELAKCIPLCWNCHKKLHAGEKPSPREERGIDLSISVNIQNARRLDRMYEVLGMDADGVINLGILLAETKLMKLIEKLEDPPTE